MARTFITPVRKIGTIELEATVKESHSSEVSITQHPVESGADITDNAVVQPKKLTIEGAFSAYQLTPSTGTIFGADSTKIPAIYDQLIRLQESRELIQVQTGLKLYRNMLITSVSVTQDKTNSQALFFTANLQEIILVDTLETKSPAYKLESGATQDKATSDQNRGDVSAPEIDTEQPRPKSILSRVFG